MNSTQSSDVVEDVSAPDPYPLAQTHMSKRLADARAELSRLNTVVTFCEKFYTQNSNTDMMYSTQRDQVLATFYDVFPAGESPRAGASVYDLIRAISAECGEIGSEVQRLNDRHLASIAADQQRLAVLAATDAAEKAEVLRIKALFARQGEPLPVGLLETPPLLETPAQA